MPSTSRRHLMLELNDLNTPENIRDLACVITSEAQSLDDTTQAVVGWTVVNRMRNNNLTHVSDVWDQYSHRHLSDGTGDRLAKAILNGSEADNSQGATHFYTPNIMPKEGEPTSGWDVDGGLETVAGVKKNGKHVKNYRPGWAKRLHRVFISGVLEKDFKLYK